MGVNWKSVCSRCVRAVFVLVIVGLPLESAVFVSLLAVRYDYCNDALPGRYNNVATGTFGFQVYSLLATVLLYMVTNFLATTKVRNWIYRTSRIYYMCRLTTYGLLVLLFF